MMLDPTVDCNNHCFLQMLLLVLVFFLLDKCVDNSDMVTCRIIFVCLVLLKVYCSDHTYTTIRVAVAATGREVINAVADKLGTTDELVLVHFSSAGGKKTVQLQHNLQIDDLWSFLH